MQINNSTPFQKDSDGAAATQASKANRNGARSYSVGQGFTFLVGAVAAMQGLRPASARVLTQVNSTHLSDVFTNIAPAPALSPAHAPAHSPNPAPAPGPAPIPAPPPPPSNTTTRPAPVTASPSPVLSPPPAPPRVTASPSPVLSPPPAPRVTASPSPVPTPNAPTSTQAGWSVNPSLSFTRKVVTTPLLASTDLASAANPFAPPTTVNPSLPYEAPHSYETCHAKISSNNPASLCVQGIATSSLSLLANGPHPLICNDTAHVFWTAENAAWSSSNLKPPLQFTNVVQFKNPKADQCCLVYRSNWDICDDIFPAQNECKDVVNSCAMLTEDAQQKILRGAVPTATGETYDIPGAPGVCGIDANNQFSCLDKTNLFNIPPGGRVEGSNVGTGFVPVDGSGCETSASTGVLSGACD